MLPGTSRTESARVDSPYERPPVQSPYHPRPYGFTQRTQIELPRPLEPRPTLHTSLSEASGSQQHHYHAFRGPVPTASEYRSQGPNLPGLRDILTAGHHMQTHPTYDNPQWTANAPGPARYNLGEARHSHSGWHPPLACHPPAAPAHAYPTARRVELPVLESSPVSRHPPQSLPVSPFTGYPESRDYVGARPESNRQASTTSYPTNGVTSPYSTASEDAQYRNGGAVCDRTAPFSTPDAGNEPQRKYIGVKEVAGEGAYHLYEDGHRIPTQVDGEKVNPAWGLTKANKPRKRLALACLDCREKKIKCEPGGVSCLQCEKAKRPCRRAPLQTSQAECMVTSPGWQNGMDSPMRKGISDPTPQIPCESEREIANKRRSREDSSPPNVPFKKHRSTSPPSINEGVTAGPSDSIAPVAMQITAECFSKSLAWDEDPYAVDRDTTIHLLKLYFVHVNSVNYGLYPRNAFLRWVMSTPEKCQLERMVLYAMLAVGSIFADDHYSGFGRQCVQIAKDAVSAKVGAFNVPVIHARLLLAVYQTAKGVPDSAWDYAGAAIRACTSNQLDLQREEKSRDPEKPPSPHAEVPFGLSDEQFKECKRRTFWSCFLMDRLEHGHLCAIALPDIFLRLPCSDEMYERGLPSDAPRFNNGIIDASQTILTATSPICAMAWTCILASIWGDVFTFRQRMQYRSDLTFAEAYGAFYEETYIRLQGWSSRLPEYLQYSEYNLSRIMREGYAATVVSLHALYQLLLMSLNRYARHRSLDPERIKRNIRSAHHHAHAMLAMCDAVQIAARQSPLPETEHLDLILSTPLVGHAIVAAIDIASAGGLDTTINATRKVVNNGLECLRVLDKRWNSAKSQLKDSQRRLYSFENILSRPFKAHGGAWLGRQWGMLEPLEKEPGWQHDEYDWAHDCIYADKGGFSSIYFQALKEDGEQGRTPVSGSVRIV
ncbi:hypothetical protein LTR12_014128 [Friedmanniomyces endolithicus]|nr:hypothetical protein LTR74_007889 [Friedmanniomyces endolithicus]KAK1811482.1 hypothetical protein LTR12_014128 [Friedmanniomyces endolithicus]